MRFFYYLLPFPFYLVTWAPAFNLTHDPYPIFDSKEFYKFLKFDVITLWNGLNGWILTVKKSNFVDTSNFVDFSKFYEWTDFGLDIHSDWMYHFLKTSIFLCIFHVEFRWTYFPDNLVFSENGRSLNYLFEFFFRFLEFCLMNFNFYDHSIC